MVKLFDFRKADVNLRFELLLSISQQLRQSVQGLRPKHHIHKGRTRNDGSTLLAGNAASYTNLHAFGFQMLDAPQITEHFFLCFFAY